MPRFQDFQDYDQAGQDWEIPLTHEGLTNLPNQGWGTGGSNPFAWGTNVGAEANPMPYLPSTPIGTLGTTPSTYIGAATLPSTSGGGVGNGFLGGLMDFFKTNAGAAAIGGGLNLLGGLLMDEDDPNAPLQSFENTGKWTDPVSTLGMANEEIARLYKALSGELGQDRDYSLAAVQSAPDMNIPGVGNVSSPGQNPADFQFPGIDLGTDNPFSFDPAKLGAGGQNEEMVSAIDAASLLRDLLSERSP